MSVWSPAELEVIGSAIRVLASETYEDARRFLEPSGMAAQRAGEALDAIRAMESGSGITCSDGSVMRRDFGPSGRVVSADW